MARKKPNPLAQRAVHLRQMGFSFREIAAREPGLSRSAAFRAAGNVPFVLRHGRGWPNRRGWRWMEEPPPVRYIDPLEYGAMLNQVGIPLK